MLSQMPCSAIHHLLFPRPQHESVNLEGDLREATRSIRGAGDEVAQTARNINTLFADEDGQLSGYEYADSQGMFRINHDPNKCFIELLHYKKLAEMKYNEERDHCGNCVHGEFTNKCTCYTSICMEDDHLICTKRVEIDGKEYVLNLPVVSEAVCKFYV